MLWWQNPIDHEIASGVHQVLKAMISTSLMKATFRRNLFSGQKEDTRKKRRNMPKLKSVKNK